MPTVSLPVAVFVAGVGIGVLVRAWRSEEDCVSQQIELGRIPYQPQIMVSCLLKNHSPKRQTILLDADCGCFELPKKGIDLEPNGESEFSPSIRLDLLSPSRQALWNLDRSIDGICSETGRKLRLRFSGTVLQPIQLPDLGTISIDTSSRESLTLSLLGRVHEEFLLDEIILRSKKNSEVFADASWTFDPIPVGEFRTLVLQVNFSTFASIANIGTLEIFGRGSFNGIETEFLATTVNLLLHPAVHLEPVLLGNIPQNKLLRITRKIAITKGCQIEVGEASASCTNLTAEYDPSSKTLTIDFTPTVNGIFYEEVSVPISVQSVGNYEDSWTEVASLVISGNSLPGS